MEIQTNNLYEINKQLSSQEKILSKHNQKEKWEQFRLWFKNDIDIYAMLLCHEQRDYTIFRVYESPSEAANILFECLNNRGKIVSIDRSGPAWEIWLRINEEDYCYYLFNYDAAVIEC